MTALLGDPRVPIRRWGFGLVLGKFRPPHLGHCYLIETALTQVDRLQIVVCQDDTSDTIPAEKRAAWIREMYPQAHNVTVWNTTFFPDEDSRFWAGMTRRMLGRVPDVVFSSEDYGDTWAHEMGCDHVCVDKARVTIPCAGRDIMANPLANLHHLHPIVRAHFIPRVRLIGADSTGKTTLARRLAAHYKTVWVPEYGRTYWDGLQSMPRDGGWRMPDTVRARTSDYVHIATVQNAMEEALARHANRVLICDTDAFVTALWHKRYEGSDAPEVLALASDPALYLHTCADLPWVDDGTRDRPESRYAFAETISRALMALPLRGVPVWNVQGDGTERVEMAIELVDRRLRELGDPLARAV